MKTADMLAGLAAEARREGIDVTTLRAIIEEASDAGAARALERLGLSDGAAMCRNCASCSPPGGRPSAAR